jgi:hypothetical protein
MATLTVNLPDALLSGLERAACLRHVSTESLLIEMAEHSLREIDAERHFRERAARGNPQRGLQLLEEIARRSGQGGLQPGAEPGGKPSR